MVVFRSPAAALSCAVDLQQRMAARPLDVEPLEIRIGVAAGEAEEEEGDYFGLPVVEGARVCAKARAGEILVTDLVRMLSRSRGAVEMERVGPMELKGLPEPVEVHRVLWAPLPRAGAIVPVPARVAASVTDPFVGREAERALLHDALKEAAAGGRRAVLIGGEPGIGKTTLTASFAKTAAEEDAWVLYGRCDEDLHVPYQPWVEAIGHLVEHAPDDLLASHLEERGAVLGRLVPQVDRRLPGGAVPLAAADDADSERVRLYAAVVDLLGRACARAPVVLLLDDLHWADEPTVQLLRHVLAAGSSLRLLVVGTFRDSEVGRRGALADALAGLHREAGVDRLPLRGLGDDELLALLESLAGHEMPPDGVALRNALRTETDGNPFFVTELLRHLSETGAIYQDEDGRWQMGLDLDRTGLPVSIREVVGSRVARLGPETERMLAMASVIGRDFDLELLAEVVDLDDDHLVDLCDAAVRAAVLSETDVLDRYTFAHALIERTLYDELSATRRARAHRSVAEALEDLCGDDLGDRVGQLAHHWARATRPQDAAKAVDYARLAGDRALQQLAPAEALRWYEEALALLDPSDRPTLTELELRIGVGGAQRLLGDEAHRETLLGAAREAMALGASDLLVRAALANSRGQASAIGVVDEERVGVIRAALDAVGPDDSIPRAKLLAVLAAELSWAVDERERHEAAALRGPDGPPAGRPADVHPGRRLLRRVALGPGHDRRACGGHRGGGPAGRRRWTTRTWGSWPTTPPCSRRPTSVTAHTLDRHLAALRPYADRTGISHHRFYVSGAEAMAAMFDGDADRIDEAAARFLEAGTDAGYADTLDQWGAMTLTSTWVRGALVDVIPMIEETHAEHPGLPIYQAVAAWAHALEGAHEPAREILDRARAVDFQMPYDVTWLLGQCVWAEAAHRVGDTGCAALVGPRIEPWAGLTAGSHVNVNMVAGHYAGLARATLGDLDEAVVLLDVALERHVRQRAPHFAAWSEVALAEVLARRGGPGDLERARTLAGSARATATERGYRYIERDADIVLATLGS